MTSTNTAFDALSLLALQFGWSETELCHARGAEGLEYGSECRTLLANGRVLCSPAFPEDCSYVRVVQQGHELAYWTSDEWREDPEGVMGAVLGCAHGVPPVELGHSVPRADSPEWQAPAHNLPDGNYWYALAGWDSQVAVRLETSQSSRKSRMVRFKEGFAPEYLADLPATAQLLPRGN